MSQEAAQENFTLFKCRILSCQYFFKDSSVAYFTDGRYATQDEGKIAELMAEVKAGHPHIYIDEEEKTASSAMQDPMSALRARIIAEYEASKKEEKDMGTTDSSAGAGAGTGTTQSLLAKVGSLQSESKA